MAGPSHQTCHVVCGQYYHGQRRLYRHFCSHTTWNGIASAFFCYVWNSSFVRLFCMPFSLQQLFSEKCFWVSRTQGAGNLLIVIFSGLVSRFVPGLVMGYYVVSTTKISELIAALERMHVPQKLIIPFSVMLRFFPTVAEEMAAINDAMRMRGIGAGVRNLGVMLEYRVVPMLMCSVKNRRGAFCSSPDPWTGKTGQKDKCLPDRTWYS